MIKSVAYWQGHSIDNALKEAENDLRLYSEILIVKSI